MASYETQLDLITSAQAQKEVTANALFDAASPAMLYGRRARFCEGLTWAYYGGAVLVNGSPLYVASGTLALPASSIIYIEADPTTGLVSSNTSGFTVGKTPLYSVTTGAATVTAYSDWRTGSTGTVVTVNGQPGPAVVLDAGDVGADPAGTAAGAVAAHEAAADPHPQYLTETAAASLYAPIGGGGSASALDADTDGTLAANSDTRVATQKAVKTYCDQLLAAADAMVFKGTLDCTANPNYPAASAGWAWRVSAAGKVGGASGTNVEVGDLLMCLTDGASAGTQAAVGSAWTITQANLDGAVIGPAASTDNHLVLFDGASGKLIKDGGAAPTGSNTGDETATSIGALIDGAAAKATPVDADYLGLMDSAAANVLKKLSWANLKATLKTYFDTLYAPTTQPFDVHAFYPGIPSASAKVVRVPVGRSVAFAANFAGSYGKASAAATASTAFDVQKNGASIGTITFAAAATTATFATSGGAAQSLVAGDIISIIAPATPDATLADAGFVLVGTR